MTYDLAQKNKEKDGGRTDQPGQPRGSHLAKDNIIEFAFWRGKEPPTPEGQNAAKLRALKELQDFAEGEKPADEHSLKLHQALNNRSAKIKLTIVTIDPKNITSSFSGPLRQLDKFLPKSRERFLADAVSHLKELAPKEGEFGPMYSLSHALVKARKDAGGALDPVNEKILAEISADTRSPAGKALRLAQDKLDGLSLVGEDGKSAKKEAILYDARDRGNRDGGNSL